MPSRIVYGVVAACIALLSAVAVLIWMRYTDPPSTDNMDAHQAAVTETLDEHSGRDQKLTQDFLVTNADAGYSSGIGSEPLFDSVPYLPIAEAVTKEDIHAALDSYYSSSVNSVFDSEEIADFEEFITNFVNWGLSRDRESLVGLALRDSYGVDSDTSEIKKAEALTSLTDDFVSSEYEKYFGERKLVRVGFSTHPVLATVGEFDQALQFFPSQGTLTQSDITGLSNEFREAFAVHPDEARFVGISLLAQYSNGDYEALGYLLSFNEESKRFERAFNFGGHLDEPWLEVPMLASRHKNE